MLESVCLDLFCDASFFAGSNIFFIAAIGIRLSEPFLFSRASISPSDAQKSSCRQNAFLYFILHNPHFLRYAVAAAIIR